MAKQLNVDLRVNADTSQAKQQLQSLQQQLSSLLSSTAANNTTLPLTAEINQALNSAAQLKVMLEQATNVNTGRLDLSKFSQQLKSNSVDLKSYASTLTSLGPAGEKAFLSLANSVITAEIPMKRSSTLLSGMLVTLKNTARWQISSSLLHNFVGAVQGAYQYTKDLNESLNNIRIVTGKDTDEMARFAKEANKAAQALSTTTTKYTDASLIFYQQGLDDEVVKARTDVTIKMANVAREGAEEVSSYMTAIWNNFNKEGEYSEEHFADVMTKLGATTASSTREIAGGLEKFASVADTIGLSFDYAASSLATIVANTRQSEDVVGTALKTIFARIQGLKLGETLEDGTSLNKYSEALHTVGIEIYDTKGNLKDMDSILDEMGARWNTLAKDQQVALAQTVAGVRQYNQLVSLMDNWDDMQKNLNTAANADGELQRQADIYAESWEAARDRVKAAAQAIYSDLIDDDFFIGIDNGISGIMNGVDKLIKSMGGLPGVLSLIGILITKAFGPQLANALDRAVYNFTVFTGAAESAAERTKIAMIDAVTAFSQGLEANSAGGLQSAVLAKQIEQTEELRKRQNSLTAEQSAYIEQLIKTSVEFGNVAVAARKAVEESEVAQGKLKADQRAKVVDNAILKSKSNGGEVRDVEDVAQYDKAIKQMSVSLTNAAKNGQNMDKAIEEVAIHISKQNQGLGLNTEQWLAVARATADTIQKEQEADNALNNYNQRLEQTKHELAAAQNALQTWSQGIVKGAQGIGQITMGINSLKGAFDALNNEDMSFGEKLLSVSMSLGFALPALINGFNALRESQAIFNAINGVTLQGILATVAGIDAETLAEARKNGVSLQSLVVDKLKAAANNEETATIWAKVAAKIAETAATWPLLAITLALVGAIVALVAVSALLITAFKAIQAASPEGKLKAAKQTAEELGEALDTAKKASEDLASSFGAYDTAVNKLKECKEGTAEWNEALMEVNNTVLDLIKKYPQLASMEGAIIRNANGQLEISDAAKQTLVDQANARVLQANAAAIRGNQQVRQAEINIAQSNLNSDLLMSLLNSGVSSTVTYGYGENSYSTDGTSELNRVLSNNIDKIFELTQEEQKDYLTQLFDDNNIIVNNIDDLISGINTDELISSNRELQASIDADAAARLIENEAIATSVLNNNSSYTSLRNTNQTVLTSAISQVSGEKYGQIYDQVKTEDAFNAKSYRKGKWYTLGIAKGGTDEGEQALAEYAKAQGWENFDVKDFQGTSAKVKYTEAGSSEVKEKDLDYEAVSNFLAAAEAQKRLADTADQTVSTFVQLNSAGGQAGEALVAIASGDLSYASESSISSIATATGTNELGQITGYKLDTAALEESVKNAGFTDLEVYAGEMGYATWQAYCDSVDAAINEYDPIAMETQRLAREQAEVNAIFAEGASKLDTSETALKGYADALADSYDGLKNNAKAAAKAAVQTAAFAKGVDKLRDVLDDNIEVLEDWANGGEATIETFEEVAKVQEALTDVFGVEVSADFVKDHLSEIKALAEGDTTALGELQVAAAKDFVLGLSIDPSIQTELNSILDKIGQMDTDIEIGASLNDTDLINGLNEAMLAGQITAEDVQKAFNAVGYEPDIKWTTAESKPQVTYTETNASIGGIPLPTIKTTTTSTTDVQVPYIATEGSAGGPTETHGATVSGSGLTKTTSTGMKAAGLSSDVKNGGPVGGGGKDNKKDIKRLDDEIDRYHELNEAIDDTTRELSRLDKERKKAYGKNALNLLDKEISKTKDLIKQKEKLLAAEQEYIKTDKEALLNAASSMGIMVDIDATTGRILNYNEAIKAALEIYNATLTDEAEEQYELFKSMLTQYEETLNLIESTQEEIEDYRDEILSKNYEKITYKLEIEVSLSENELKEYEYYFNKLSEDIYTTAEAMAYLTNQIQATEGILDAYNTAFNSLTAAYNAGEISQADYADGLQNCYDNIMSNIEALDELDDQMKHYYGETLAKAVEELSHYTDRLGHLSEVADHYQKILELTNNKKNYEMTSKLLKTQENLAKNSYDAAKAWYESRKKAGAEIISNWNSVKDDPKAKNYDFYKQQYLDYIEELEKAESDMLDKAEALGEALKETLSNAMAEAAYNMEQALSGTFNTFDELNNAIKNMSSNVEEYLTKTNQIYETNKLLNKIGQDVQKTNNTAAKQKYAAFAEEIKQLQQKDQLSNLELEIANAKYELLQKQIALEEARNATTTVRLSRDSEGNYGYVYTADDEKITQAEQDLQDAENALYNIRLKATNDYGQKRLQAQQDLANTLLDIDTKYQEGAYETEEQWQAARANAIAQYTTLITTYGNLYGIAQEDDARVVQDAWVNSFTEITTSGNNWQEAIEGYCTTTQEALEAWETATHDIKEVTEKDLKDLTTAGEDLADEIIKDVVPALDTELATALKNSQDYLEDERDSVLAARDAYLELAASIREAIAAEAERSGTPSDNAEKPEEETPAEEPKGEEPKPAGGDLSKGSSVTVKSTATHFSRDGGNGTRMQSWVPGSAFTVMQISGNEVLIGRNGGYTGWIKKTDLEGFKTGGYTGDWGTEGKLALLHKKELVLNKQDTSNILASVEIMRELTRSIDTQAGWASTGLGMLHAATAGHNPDILEQQVTITAEFPNATDHNEIEEAFNSLINRASQYANRY